MPDPRSWEDKNDTYFLEKYRQLFGMETVLAICFTMGAERANHWRMFAGDISGVCIEFRRAQLLKYFPPGNGILHRAVSYRTIRYLETNGLQPEELPFVKRTAYRDEKEYRIIFSTDTESTQSKFFVVDLSCIDRIKLNPWIPLPLVEPVKDTIKSIDGCGHIKIFRTTLLENEAWMNIAENMG